MTYEFWIKKRFDLLDLICIIGMLPGAAFLGLIMVVC